MADLRATLERIIGRNDVPRSFVERALEMSQAVGRVVLHRRVESAFQPMAFGSSRFSYEKTES